MKTFKNDRSCIGNWCLKIFTLEVLFAMAVYFIVTWLLFIVLGADLGRLPPSLSATLLAGLVVLLFRDGIGKVKSIKLVRRCIAAWMACVLIGTVVSTWDGEFTSRIVAFPLSELGLVSFSWGGVPISPLPALVSVFWGCSIATTRAFYRRWGLHDEDDDQVRSVDCRTLVQLTVANSLVASMLLWMLLAIAQPNINTLTRAATRGDDRAVRWQLWWGVDPNAPSRYGYRGHASGHTPLTAASFNGQLSTVELLAQHHADLDLRSGSERFPDCTALASAAMAGHRDVCIRLLDLGASPNVPCAPMSRGRGWTALDWAKQAGHESIAELIQQRGGQTGDRARWLEDIANSSRIGRCSNQPVAHVSRGRKN